MKIDINSEACGNPLDCRLCLDRCPEKVFGTYPRGRRHPGVAPGDWVIIPLFASRCTGCNECLTFCPKQAILVQRLSLRQKVVDAISLVRDLVRKGETAWAWK
jgi:Pyruvate/2-oxoacid:ferredoxin oxidoreductase delta subunit